MIERAKAATIALFLLSAWLSLWLIALLIAGFLS